MTDKERQQVIVDALVSYHINSEDAMELGILLTMMATLEGMDEDYRKVAEQFARTLIWDGD